MGIFTKLGTNKRMIKFGIVKSVGDPKKLGRVKVAVYDVHRNIDTVDLIMFSSSLRSQSNRN